MGGKKKSSKPPPKKTAPKLVRKGGARVSLSLSALQTKQFTCPFCNNEKSVVAKM